ncbi:glycosyltransferase family 4 protein [Salinibacter ruber]|uniref:glycosyltransferase family 4 protein n=1 Tax=Salinibacter ruber TaxID=146919 RepID=UPI00161C8689|nr:glycosyltransferase family 4 protein [Salinibacter ruber]MBB4062111.1 glycosyltransferase involved in cell wall biosynthesis [Salinibacter ruber]
MRVLFVVRTDPYPPEGGAALRNWQNIRAAQELGEVGVVAVGLQEAQVSLTPPEISTYRSFEHRSQERSALGHIIHRAVQVLHPFRHHRIDGVYDSHAAEGLSAVIEEFCPEVVVFEEVWLYPYSLGVESKRPTTVLDAHNVESQLRSTIEEAREDKGIIHAIERAALERIERAFYKRADQVWVCSEEDRRQAQALYGQGTPTQIIPNGVSTAYYEDVREQREHKGLKSEEPVITFIGGYGYPPNRHAAHFLIDRVWPKVREQEPSCRLALVGGSPTSYMTTQAAEKDRLEVPGRVPDVRPFLVESDAVVTPLFEGGGTRLKILEAFSSRCPVVSTAKGVEGLDVQHEQHVLLGETADELAAQSLRLFREPELREHLVQNSWDRVQEAYSWTKIGKTIRNALTEAAG